MSRTGKKEAALIDNNDSFTYNIVELIRQIPGWSLTVIPSELTDVSELGKFDKLILSPGPGLPNEFPVLQKILDSFYSTKPILGICLGHEAIAQYFGAELMHLSSVIHGQPKEIHVIEESILFKNIPLKFTAGLYHSWVIDKGAVPSELYITGLSDEGYIMSFQHREFNLFGVQFHPESIITEYGKELMENFLNIEAG